MENEASKVLAPIHPINLINKLNPFRSRPALAAGEIPSQDDWIGSKKEIGLETGITMKYVDVGPPDAKPLVLIHGMTDSSRSWSLMAPFVAGSFRLIMPDLRGHGGTDKPDLRMYPVSLYAADVAFLMASLGVEKAHVAGHSLGSMIAQALAINYPEKVDKLALVSSALVSAEPRVQEFYAATVAWGDNLPDDELMETIPNPATVDEGFLGRMKSEAGSLPPRVWRAIAKGLASSTLVHRMDEIKAPTLIMWGSLDGLFGPVHQEALRKDIPGASFVAYEGRGHNLHWELPEKVAGDLSAFLGA